MAELFAHFEVDKELRWPVILRLLGGSLVAHLLLIACLMYVPAFRDALNLASLIADTNFVDKAYEVYKLRKENYELTHKLLDANDKLEFLARQNLLS